MKKWMGQPTQAQKQQVDCANSNALGKLSKQKPTHHPYKHQHNDDTTQGLHVIDALPREIQGSF